MQSKFYLVILLSPYWIFNSIESYKWDIGKHFLIENCRDVAQTNSRIKATHNRVKEIHGKVIKIADGDTFTLIFDNDFDVRVRLNGIDCPEKSQPYSNKAKQALSDFIFGKMVVVQYKEKDRYGRVIGDVYIDGLNVNYEMVKLGLAWHFKRYSDDEELDSLEKDARYKRIGLWSDKKPIPPWEWRKGIRELKE